MTHGKDNRLDQLLASYGANPAHWPAAERGGASTGQLQAATEAREIDHVLSLATTPEVPDGAIARLMGQIGVTSSADVILFTPKPRRIDSILRYAAAVPLAASLTLGLYLGAAGRLDFMLPTSLTNDVAATDTLTDDLGGVGDAEAYAEETLT